MLSYLHSYFTTINHDQSHKRTKKNQSKYIYRDELDNSTITPSKLRRRAHHKTTEEKSSLLEGKTDQAEGKNKRETKVIIEDKKEIRLKVRMTKEEAKRLLSKCRKGGLLEFGDVAHELSKINANRIRMVNSSTIVGDQVLQSIAEED